MIFWMKKRYMKEVSLIGFLSDRMVGNNKRVLSFLDRLSKGID